MPPLSAQEQDGEQGNNEAENGGAFCQGGAQQQAGPDAGAQQGQYYDADYKVVDDDENNKK